MAAKVLRWREQTSADTVKGEVFQLFDDPRETPIYGVAEAAAYVGVPRSTLRHWLAATPKCRAIIETPDESGQLSFYNLSEAHIVRVALERDAWLHRIRSGVERLREKHPDSKHPLLEVELSTASGYRDLFVAEVAGDIENISLGGQLAFRQVLKRYLSRIDRDSSGRPIQLRPYRFRHVAINHRVSGGRPVIAGTGILVEMVASRARSGESVEQLAHDYGITTADVRDALRYSAA
jgi:uncharacterized protein (DUF433 family)